MLSTYIGLKWYNAVGNPFEKHHFFDVACEWHAFIYYMHTELPTCTDSEEVSTSTSSKDQFQHTQSKQIEIDHGDKRPRRLREYMKYCNLTFKNILWFKLTHIRLYTAKLRTYVWSLVVICCLFNPELF